MAISQKRADQTRVGKARTQMERRAATQAAVLDSACRLFGENGYNQTSLEDIAADCGTTIRPIYHYFGNKKQLFQVVTETFEQRLVEVLSSVDVKGEQFVEEAPVTAYWSVFSALAKDAAFRQVVLVDSPHILGRERWVNTAVVVKATEIIQSRFPSLSGISQTLFTRMLIGALSEGVLVFADAESEDSDKLLDQVFTLINTFIK
ncbi:hypothetical protein A9Q81_21120 [Gammaproteobacteria bacterium 42_54_T18]|nr:hypothetical protein A9Q81_21120 [Gammaproteobacteria bacterium 42_54_T18]